MTQTGLSLGTPQYMSPEQAMSERNIDARSDIYALGAVTYEMPSGEPPFTGPTAQAIVARVMTDNPHPLPEVRQTVSSQLDDAVATALQRLPADRFSSAAEFAAALSATGATPKPRSASRVNAPASRRVVVALCPLSVIAIAAAVWGWVRAARRPTAATVSPWRTVLTFPDSSGTPRGHGAVARWLSAGLRGEWATRITVVDSRCHFINCDSDSRHRWWNRSRLLARRSPHYVLGSRWCA